jgi:hypothetical protein
VWPDNWKEWTISIFLVSVTVLSIYMVISTGAFSTVRADRTASVNVVDDTNGGLVLRPYDGPNGHPSGGDPAYARTSSNGQIELNTAGGFGGLSNSGVNLNSNTDIENVFVIANRGDREVAVSVETHDDIASGENGEYANEEDDAVMFYHTHDDGRARTPETPLNDIKPEGSKFTYESNEYTITEEEVELDPGESITVSMRIDTSVDSVAGDANRGDDLLDSITVIADASVVDDPNTEVGDNDGTSPDGD